MSKSSIEYSPCHFRVNTISVNMELEERLFLNGLI